MNDFKAVLGFLLLGFAVYLMLGLPSDLIIPTVGLCLFLAFSVVVYTRVTPFGSSWKRKLVTGGVALSITGLGMHINYNLIYNAFSETAIEQNRANEGKKWNDFSVELLKKAHLEKKPVMIDFTANWCLNCQFNKAAVLYTKDIGDMIDKKGVVAIKADLTQPDPEIESLLKHLGSRSIPFLAIFPGDTPEKPVIMRDIYKKSSVKNILNQLPDQAL
jgi:thiol:disulfide interchange protein